MFLAMLEFLIFPNLTGLGCDRAFCGAYWHTQGFGGSDSHPVCSRETLKPVCATALWYQYSVTFNNLLIKIMLTLPPSLYVCVCVSWGADG